MGPRVHHTAPAPVGMQKPQGCLPGPLYPEAPPASSSLPALTLAVRGPWEGAASRISGGKQTQVLSAFSPLIYQGCRPLSISEVTLGEGLSQTLLCVSSFFQISLPPPRDDLHLFGGGKPWSPETGVWGSQ